MLYRLKMFRLIGLILFIPLLVQAESLPVTVAIPEGFAAIQVETNIPDSCTEGCYPRAGARVDLFLKSEFAKTHRKPLIECALLLSTDEKQVCGNGHLLGLLIPKESLSTVAGLERSCSFVIDRAKCAD